MKAEALTALADRVEREEPSRYLDADIEEAEKGAATADPPYYTTSLDAAVTLVPEGVWDVTSTGCAWWMPEAVGSDIILAHGKTPAAALSAAALRARAADMQARAEDGAPHPSPSGNEGHDQ